VASEEGGAADLWSSGKNARTQSLKVVAGSDHKITSRSFCGRLLLCRYFEQSVAPNSCLVDSYPHENITCKNFSRVKDTYNFHSS
jgi:hypothetical protein